MSYNCQIKTEVKMNHRFRKNIGLITFCLITISGVNSEADPPMCPFYKPPNPEEPENVALGRWCKLMCGFPKPIQEHVACNCEDKESDDPKIELIQSSKAEQHEFRTKIVKAINDLRTKVAKGELPPLPKAADMMYVNYNLLSEYVVRCAAKKRKKDEPCRKIPWTDVSTEYIEHHQPDDVEIPDLKNADSAVKYFLAGVEPLLAQMNESMIIIDPGNRSTKYLTGKTEVYKVSFLLTGSAMYVGCARYIDHKEDFVSFKYHVTCVLHVHAGASMRESLTKYLYDIGEPASSCKYIYEPLKENPSLCGDNSVKNGEINKNGWVVGKLPYEPWAEGNSSVRSIKYFSYTFSIGLAIVFIFILF